MSRVESRRRGFTLIELLVVVAIIAVLISILLPSLSEAREQGKVAKCVANLKMTLTATHSYFNDSNDVFPFMVKASGICSWSYAGQKTDDYWKGPAGGSFYFEPKDKVMNRHILNVALDTLDVNTKPESLHCPSDKQSNQRKYIDPNDTTPISSWDDVGLSYHYNLYSIIDVGPGSPWKNDGWAVRGRALVRESQAGFSGRFTLLFEDAVDWSLYDLTQEIGYHRKFSKHAAGYLDAHAEYRLLDTRSYCGPGWVTINPNWVKSSPGWAGYWYYTVGTINCEPPP